MERVSQLAGAFLTFAPEMWIYLGGWLFRCGARFGEWAAPQKFRGCVKYDAPRPRRLLPLEKE